MGGNVSDARLVRIGDRVEGPLLRARASVIGTYVARRGGQALAVQTAQDDQISIDSAGCSYRHRRILNVTSQPLLEVDEPALSETRVGLPGASVDRVELLVHGEIQPARLAPLRLALPIHQPAIAVLALHWCAAVRIEAPQHAPCRCVESHQPQLRRGDVGDTVGDQRRALHLGPVEGVSGVVAPGLLSVATFVPVDLRQRAIVCVAEAAAVGSPLSSARVRRWQDEQTLSVSPSPRTSSTRIVCCSMIRETAGIKRSKVGRRSSAARGFQAPLRKVKRTLESTRRWSAAPPNWQL